MAERRLPPALLALTPGRGGPVAIARAVETACAAGLRGVLLREPALADREYLALARALRAVLAPSTGGWLGLHDRPHLAAACGADGVHLGRRSLPPEQVRPWVGASLALGLSTHAGEDPGTWALADYLFHGPVGAVDKPGAGEPVGAQGIGRAAARSPVPVWALGGVRPEDLAALRAHGAAGVAVMSRLLGCQDPGGATRGYLEAWEAAASGSEPWREP